MPGVFRRQEGFRYAHPGESRLEVIEVAREVGLTDIAQLIDADRHGLPAGVASARMRREIFGEFRLVARGHAEPTEPGARPILTAGDPRRDVIGKVGLRQFAVVYDVETARDLTFDDLRHCGP